jgi:hypothetical protein
MVTIMRIANGSSLSSIDSYRRNIGKHETNLRSNKLLNKMYKARTHSNNNNNENKMYKETIINIVTVIILFILIVSIIGSLESHT